MHVPATGVFKVAFQLPDGNLIRLTQDVTLQLQNLLSDLYDEKLKV